MRNKINLVFILLLLTTTSITCKKSETVEPEADKPGRRDYTWKADTLKVTDGNLFYVFSLWGSSPNDVWAVGHGSSSAVTLWHYDGSQWKNNNPLPNSNLQAIWGFAQNDVWMCDSPGKGVYHYNGVQWTNAYSYSSPGTLLGLNNIWGDTPNSIYASGSIDSSEGNYKGVVMKYDGSSWKILPIPCIRVAMGTIRGGVKENGRYFIVGKRFESIGDTNKIYMLEGNNIKEIYSGRATASVNDIKGRVYICLGKKIYKYQADQLTVWKDFSSEKHGGRVWGRSEIDFFTVSSDGLSHYNGTDLVTIYPTRSMINEVFVLEKDVFIILDFKIIVHGTLK